MYFYSFGNNILISGIIITDVIKKYVKNNLCARVTSRRRRKSLIGVGVNGIADARAEIDIEMNDCVHLARRLLFANRGGDGDGGVKQRRWRCATKTRRWWQPEN